MSCTSSAHAWAHQIHGTEIQSGTRREQSSESGNVAGNCLRGAGFHCPVQPQNLVACGGQRCRAAGGPAFARLDQRTVECLVQRSGKAPRPPVAHSQVAGGLGDGAGFGDHLKEIGLARADGVRWREMDPDEGIRPMSFRVTCQECCPFMRCVSAGHHFSACASRRQLLWAAWILANTAALDRMSLFLPR